MQRSATTKNVENNHWIWTSVATPVT